MQSTCTCPADLPDEVCGRCGGPLSECLPDERKRDGHWWAHGEIHACVRCVPRRSTDRVRVLASPSCCRASACVCGDLR